MTSTSSFFMDPDPQMNDEGYHMANKPIKQIAQGGGIIFPPSPNGERVSPQGTHGMSKDKEK